MIKITADNINIIPNRRRKVNRPSNTKTEIQTAVTGSKAPIIAVGVEPANRIPMFNSVIAIMVGTMATMQIQPRAFAEDIGIMLLSGSKKEEIAIATAANNMI